MSPQVPVLHKLIDEFSYQVYSDSDDRFWFRLVREADCDIITDFLLGAFPRTEGGELLVQCYRTLGLTPARTIKFTDIHPSQKAAPVLPDDARVLYADAGRRLLADSGSADVEVQLEESRGRMNLVLRPRTP